MRVNDAKTDMLLLIGAPLERLEREADHARLRKPRRNAGAPLVLNSKGCPLQFPAARVPLKRPSHWGAHYSKSERAAPHPRCRWLCAIFALEAPLFWGKGAL